MHRVSISMYRVILALPAGYLAGWLRAPLRISCVCRALLSRITCGVWRNGALAHHHRNAKPSALRPSARVACASRRYRHRLCVKSARRCMAGISAAHVARCIASSSAYLLQRNIAAARSYRGVCIVSSTASHASPALGSPSLLALFRRKKACGACHRSLCLSPARAKIISWAWRGGVGDGANARRSAARKLFAAADM